MRTLILLTAVLCVIATRATAQTTWSTTGNSGTSPGTHFIGTTDAKDVVFKTQNIERGRLLNSSGAWRFGTSSNYARIDAAGKLTFSGTGAYQVGANKYVFQYSGLSAIGLYYNHTSSAHQFRDSNGGVVASVGSLTGNGYFKGNLGIGNTAPAFKLDVSGTGRFTGTLKVGAYTLPSTDGTAGQVLTSNGAGIVSWTTMASGGNSQWTSSSGNIYYNGGNTGIGTSSPAYKLDVTGTGRFTGALKVGAYLLPSTDGTAGQVLTSNGTGTVSWTTPSSGGSNPWTLNGSNIYFGTGDVGIGTSDLAAGFKLSVLGKIMCEEVKVQLASSWPDYVFNDGYYLMPLEALAEKIASNNHLPGIPTAEEIEEQGLGLGEMQAMMMEKIEELTLYLINANNDMVAANERILLLQKEIESLQLRIKQLESSN